MVWVHVYEMCRIGKSREAKCRLMFAKGWGRGNGVSLFNRNRIYVCGNENIPYLDTNDDSILVNINILMAWMVQLKIVKVLKCKHYIIYIL